MMKRCFLAAMVLLCTACGNQFPEFFPANKAQGVNPDTHLILTFDEQPQLGTQGMIRIIDAATGMVADSLDMSIPAGPTSMQRGPKAPYAWEPYIYERDRRLTNRDVLPGTPSGCAAATADTFQLTIIGGFTDAFHFYPALVRGNSVVIYPHHDLLQYGKSYYVTVDKEVIRLAETEFKGIAQGQWQFSTRSEAPAWHQGEPPFVDRGRPADGLFVTVSADGKADFSTVQGALDFADDNLSETHTIYVRNGDYEELVYARNKSHLRIVGESRDGVVVHYANNEMFNPHPVDVSTNEWPGTFPSRRAAFTLDNCHDLYVTNLTAQTDYRGQAEGLLIMGSRNHLYQVRIVGDGDALQANGSLYMEDCEIDGGGDTMLGRGPVFLKNCLIKNNGGPFMWIRNTDANHGDVFVNCRFQGNDKRGSVFARAPINGGQAYPYAEAVLIDCVLEGIPAIGWGPVGGDTRNVHYWEYNSRTPDGQPVDVSQRVAPSRQLTLPADAKIIENYRQPAFVLDGWDPTK